MIRLLKIKKPFNIGLVLQTSYFYSKIFIPKSSSGQIQQKTFSIIPSVSDNDKNMPEEINKINNKNLSNAFDSLVNAPIDNMELVEMLMLKCEDLLGKQVITVQNTEDALKLVSFLSNMKLHTATYQIERKKNEKYLVTQEVPANYDRFRKKLEQILVKTNITLKDLDLLLETTYQIPNLIHDNMAFYVFIREYVKNNHSKLNISILLFFLARICLDNRLELSLFPQVNEVLKKYKIIKEDLFDLGMILFIYYESMNKYYMGLNVNEKKQTQYFSLAFESRFRMRKNLGFMEVIETQEHYEKLFYEICIENVLKLVKKFEKGELPIRDEYFIQGLLFNFKTLARFRLVNKELIEAVEKYTIKFNHHLSLNDKIMLLQTYTRYLNTYPNFIELLEKTITSNLKEVIWTMLYKPKYSILKSTYNNVYQTKTFYDHVKSKLDVFMDEWDTPEICNLNKENFITIDNIVELYWCVSRIHSKNASEIIGLANKLVDITMELCMRSHMIDLIGASSSLSLKFPDEFDWKDEIRKKIENLGKRLAKIDDAEQAKIYPNNSSKLYNLLQYYECKYQTQLVPEYLSEKQMDYFRSEWFKANLKIKRSRLEMLVYDTVESYIKEKNLNREVSYEKYADIYPVDVFIQPNIVLEISSKYNVLQDSNSELIKDSFFGQYMLKLDHLKLKGYNVILLNYFEFQEFLDNEEDLRKYVISKISPIL